MHNNQGKRTNFRAIIPTILFLIGLLISGCGGDEVPSDTTPIVPTPTDLPAPTPQPPSRDIESPVATVTTNAGSDASYPAPLSATTADRSYPAPVQPTPETSRIPIVPFVLDRPLEPGATIVRGSGPANVPIVIANVFLMGEIMGEGVIDANGRFEVAVAPLEKGYWIGIAPDDLSGTDFAYEDFYPQGFRGPGAEQVPQVGFLYDSEFVR